MVNPRLAETPRPLFENPRRDLKVLTKSEPETLYEENLARDFILRKSEQVSKTVCGEARATRYSKINKNKIDKSRVAPTYSKDCYRTFLVFLIK